MRRSCAARADHRCARSLPDRLLPASSHGCSNPAGRVRAALRRRGTHSSRGSRGLAAVAGDVDVHRRSVAARLGRDAIVRHCDGSARAACAAAARRGLALHRQRCRVRDARDRARIVESPGCRVVGGVPARAHRGGARDAQRHRAVGECVSHRAGVSVARFAPSFRASLLAVLASAQRRLDPVDRVGRGGRRADPVLRLSRSGRPRAVVGIRVRRKRAARRAQ